MSISWELRQAVHPEHFRNMDTARIRKEFLVEDLMQENKIRLVYCEYERFIVGGVVPVKDLLLEPIDILRSDYFLYRRELGIINVGGTGEVTVDGKSFLLDKKEALYVGKGSKEVVFRSLEKGNPAHYYLNSAPAHQDFPVRKIGQKDAIVVELGSMESSNARTINKLIVNELVQTCQLQMGLTDLKPGSVWNTMPPHLHDRRNEVYFYFDLPGGQAICHFMGKPDETRPVWLQNEQAVVSPPWSLHAAAGTFNYSFIWGMAGENLNYGDMDHLKTTDLR